MAKTGEVAPMHCLGSLDLDSDQTAVGTIEDRVHLDVFLRSVAEALGAYLCPCELSREFRDDEVLDEWTDQRIVTPKPGLGETAQVAANAVSTKTTLRNRTARAVADCRPQL